jgi:hypothetical protein
MEFKSWWLAWRKAFCWALLALLIFDLSIKVHTASGLRIASLAFGAVAVAVRLVLFYKRPNY